MKRILTFCATTCLVAGVVLLSSCKKDETTPTPPPGPKDPVALAVPANVVCESTSVLLAFTWGTVENAATYAVEFRMVGAVASSASVATAAWAKDGLESETDYEFRVKAVPVEDSETYLESPWTEWAAYTTVEGTVAKKFKSGSGTEADPYIIVTPAQLMLLAQLINDEEPGYCEYGVYYELGADIDLKEYSEWTPIGIGPGSETIGVSNPTIVKGFRGQFSGANHKVTNLKVVLSGNEAEIYAGLFGLNRGWIEFLNVEGSVSASSTYTEGGLLMVGGICGLSGIGYGEGGQTDVQTHTGGLVGCSFKGSIKSNSNMDVAGVAFAGGICGHATNGNIDNSTVTILSGESIHAIGGHAPAAGGVVGYQDAGRLTGAEVTIAGSILAEYIDGAQHSNDSAAAGGVFARCFRLQDANGQPGVANCNITVSGSISAFASGESSFAAAGALGGVSCFDAAVSCSAEITGKIIAESESSTYVGGLMGGMTAGGGANQMGLCTVNIKGELSGKQKSATVTGSNGNALVGGLVGGLLSNASGTLSSCSAVIDGQLRASNAATKIPANVGGAIASSANLGGVSVIMTSNAVIDVASDMAAQIGGIVGMYRGNVGLPLIGCYSHIQGTINTRPFTAGGAYRSYVGGISGFMQPAGVQTSIRPFQKACYSVFNPTVNVESSASDVKTGALTGTGTRSSFLNCYWSGMSVFATGMDSAETATGGTNKFATLDKAGYEAAMADMNEALVTAVGDDAAQYKYDAAKGYLVF